MVSESKVGAVVVLYNPDIKQVREFILTISKQVSSVCIIDNSIEKHSLIGLSNSIDYIHQPQNIGVAAAHNLGLNRFLAKGYHYALLFDQDSHIESNFVNRIVGAYRLELAHKKRPLIAVGPIVKCSFTEKLMLPVLQKPLDETERVIYLNQIISSGMLINIENLNDVGLKNEALFIDAVDHEWCWRAKRAGFEIGIAKGIIMTHRLGDARGKLLGFTYKIGSPIRLYYQFRNIILLSTKDYVPLYWKIRNLAAMPLRFLINSILLSKKRERILFMVRGLFDGAFGRTGAYNGNWRRK